ncbi:MAG TPA: HAMP domain-containing sensor histidine kinase [Clostridia bacterium]|nr:HAMP domain-containing sensor histidine kinase [Clostridia bacterium]
MNGITSVKVRKRQLLLGAFLVLSGIFAPMAFNIGNFGISELLHESIVKADTGKLILAAFKLVILNSIRALPHYLGAFIIAEAITVVYRGRNLNWMKGFLAILIIPVVYRLIYYIHGFNYDFGIPAFIALTSIILIENLNYSNISIAKKSFIFILMLLGVQWLDVIPGLSAFGFGRGEVSSDVKLIASFIEADEVLTFAGVIFLVIFTVNAIMINKILSDEQRLIYTIERNKEIEKGLEAVRIKALQSRTYQEMQSLVHDLKTPLTSIQALASVSGMMTEDGKLKLYMEKIVESVDNMNQMVSEILYEEKKGMISTAELFEYVFSQIVSNECKSRIRFENSAPDMYIYANKIRLSRAIINIINNSFDAIDGRTGLIQAEVSESNGYIYIVIEDNGTGIPVEDIERVLELGYSTKNSTGLGLSFAKSVIENHEGEFDLVSDAEHGTTITVVLPGGGNFEQNEGAGNR